MSGLPVLEPSRCHALGLALRSIVPALPSGL